MSHRLPCRSRTTVSCLIIQFLFVTGCSPTPVAPQSPVHSEPVAYDQPDTSAKPIPIASVNLLVDTKPTAIDGLPTVRARELVAFSGAIQHPDSRMIGGSVQIQLLQQSKDGQLSIVNEAVGPATGAEGLLNYRIELRIPDAKSRKYVIKLFYHGLQPDQEPTAPPVPWTVEFAEAGLIVE